MNRKTSGLSLFLGALVLFPALAPAPQAKDEGGKRKALADSKVAVARKIVEFYADVRLAPPGNGVEGQSIPGAEPVEFWNRRLVDARLEASTDKAQRIGILTEDFERAKAIESRIKDLAEGGRGFGKLDALKAEFNRLDAESRLWNEKAGS